MGHGGRCSAFPLFFRIELLQHVDFGARYSRAGGSRLERDRRVIVDVRRDPRDFRRTDTADLSGSNPGFW